MTQQTATASSEHTKSAKGPVPSKPKGWIRWSGLLAFIAIVGGVIAITYLSLSLLLKSQLESLASDAWGAKVEIGSLDLGVMPIRVGLYDLVATDPDQPMKNLFEIGRLSASLNFYHLVVGRTVIEDVSLMGLKFDQPRKTSGALPKPKPVKSASQKVQKAESESATSKSSQFEVPKMVVPDPDKILTRDNLKTLQAAAEIEQKIDQLQQDWQKVEKQLPNDKVLKDYEKRLTQLTQGKIENLNDLDNKKKQFEQLQKDVKAHQKTYQRAEAVFKQLPVLQADVEALQKLPEEDFNRLSKTYSLDAKGFSNLTYLLYGPKIQGYLQKGYDWYEKAQPFIAQLKQKMAESAAEEAVEISQRSFGTDVAFKEYDPQPDFVIKRVHLETEIDWGQLEVLVTQLNFDQATSHLPVKFVANLQQVGQSSALQVSGESNFIDPDNGFHSADIHWSGYQVKDWSLLKEDSLPIKINSALTNVAGSLLIHNQDQIKGDMTLDYQAVDFDLTASQSKEVRQYLVPIFDDIKAFKVQSDFKGDLWAPKIEAKSNLDRLLSDAFNKVLDKEITAQKRRFKQAFDQRVAEELAPINKELSALLGDEMALTADQQGLDKIASIDVNRLIAKEKQKYQQQLEAETRQKLEAEKQRLAKEKARLEAEAKKKLEAEKKKLAKEQEKQQKELEKKASDEAQKLLKGMGF